MFIVMLEGKDPARTKKLLETLLEKFKKLATDENLDKIGETKEYAQARLGELKKKLDALDEQDLQAAQGSPDHRPGRKEHLRRAVYQPWKHAFSEANGIGELNQQLMIARSFPRADFSSDEADRAAPDRDARDREEEVDPVLEQGQANGQAI